MLGLFSIFLRMLHLITWIWLDKFFDLHEMWADIVKRRFITMGMLGFLLMLPLALTSTAGWIRRMGGKNWQRLHRAVYVSAVAGVIHYYWLVKSDIRMPLLYAVILGVVAGCGQFRRALHRNGGAARRGRKATHSPLICIFGFSDNFPKNLAAGYSRRSTCRRTDRGRG